MGQCMSGCKRGGMHGIFKIYNRTLYIMVIGKKTCKITGVYGAELGGKLSKVCASIILPKGHGHVKYHRIPWPKIVH